MNESLLIEKDAQTITIDQPLPAGTYVVARTIDGQIVLVLKFRKPNNSPMMNPPWINIDPMPISPVIIPYNPPYTPPVQPFRIPNDITVTCNYAR